MNVAPLISHELGLEEVQDFLDGKIQASPRPSSRSASSFGTLPAPLLRGAGGGAD